MKFALLDKMGWTVPSAIFAKWFASHLSTNKWMVSVSLQTLLTFSLVYVTFLLLHIFGSKSYCWNQQ